MQKRSFVEFIIHQSEQKTELFMNKPVYLRLFILEISKIVMHIRKIKNGEKAKSCYMDTDNFIVYIKTEDIYSDIAKDVETRLDTSNYKLDRPLPIRKNKKQLN